MWSIDLNFLDKESASRFGFEKPEWNKINLESSKQNPGPLSRHSVVLFNNGAFVYGGLRPNGSANCELFKFDLKSLKWELAKQKDDLPGEREGHSCCLVDDTMILFGGFETGERTNDIIRYNFQSHRWTRL